MQRTAFDATTGEYLAPTYPYTETFTEETRYAQMVSVSTGITWVAAASDNVVFSGGTATLTSGDDKYVNMRLRSYKEGSGGYEFAFDDNGDGGGGDSYNGNMFAMQDINNFYNAVIFNGTAGSRFEVWRIKAGTWTRLGFIDANATYIKGSKTWINVTYDNTRGVIRANYRTDAGTYNVSPDLTIFDTSFKYGYSGLWTQVASSGAGNLNVVFSDLSWHTESLVGETNIPATQTGFVFSDDATANRVGRTTSTYGIWTWDTVNSKIVSTSTTISSTVRFDPFISTPLTTETFRFKNIDTTSEAKNIRVLIGWDGDMNSALIPSNGYEVYFYTASSTTVGAANKIGVFKRVVGSQSTLLALTSVPGGIPDNTLMYVKVIWNANNTISVYCDQVDGTTLIGTSSADTTFTTGKHGFLTYSATAAKTNVEFSAFTSTGTRYYMKPMLRGASIGEYYDGAATVQATRFTDDFNWDTISEYTQTSGTWSVDTTNGAMGKSATGRQILKAGVLQYGSGTYQTTLTFKSLTSAAIGYAILWDGTSDGATIPYNSVYIRISSAGLFGMFLFDGVGGNTAIGTGTTISPTPSINNPITISTSYNSTTGVLVSNAYSTSGVLLGTPTGTISTGRIGYVGLVQTGASTVVIANNLQINALESTSTNGVALGIGGIAHGGRYDTNEFVGINFTETTPNTYYQLSVLAVSTNATYNQVQNNLWFIDQTGTSFSNLTAATNRAFRVGTSPSTRTTLGWDNESLTTTTNQFYYTFINYTKWSGSAYDFRGGMVYIYPAIAESFFSPSAPTPSPVNGSVWANWSSNVTSGLKPLPVQFTDQSEADPLYPITTWNWTVDLGVYSDTPNPEYTYTTNGTKTITLRVNNTLEFDSLTKTIFVGDLNSRPMTDFTSNVTTVCMDDYVQFTDLTGETGGGLPTWWWWTFGDSQDSHIQNATHAYDTPGVYTVSLWTQNKWGEDVNIKTDYITVVSCYNANFTANLTCSIGKPRVVSLNGTCRDTDLGKAAWRISPNESWSYWDGTDWLPDFDGSFNGDDNHDYNAIINFTSYGAYTITRTCNFGAPIGIITETKVDYIKIGVNGTYCGFPIISSCGKVTTPILTILPIISIIMAMGFFLYKRRVK